MDITNNLKNTLLYLLLFLISCNSPAQTVVEEIDANRLKELSKGDVLLLDVRTPGEYQQGRIKGSVLVNFRDSNFADIIATMETDKPVIVYCAAGGRSTNSIKTLKDAGFKTIYNYVGGFSDWRSRGEEIEN